MLRWDFVGPAGATGPAGPAGAAGAAGADGPPGRRNVLINGAFEIWQAGTSWNAATSGYLADMWEYNQSNDGSMDIARSTDVPSVANGAPFAPTYSILLQPDTADASLGTDQYAALVTKIEGNNYLKIKGREMAMSFWVKSSKIGKYCVSFRNSGKDRSYIYEYEILVANTWEHKHFTVTFDQTGGTEHYGANVGLIVAFTLAAGSDFQAAKDGWRTGNFLGTSDQVNFMDSTSNEFRLALVQMGSGLDVDDYEFRHEGEELLLCQRYFEILAGIYAAGAYASGVDLLMVGPIYYQAVKRAVPTPTYDQPKYRTGAGWVDATVYVDATDIDYISPIVPGGGGTITTCGHMYFGSITLSSRLTT